MANGNSNGKIWKAAGVIITIIVILSSIIGSYVKTQADVIYTTKDLYRVETVVKSNESRITENEKKVWVYDERFKGIDEKLDRLLDYFEIKKD